MEYFQKKRDVTDAIVEFFSHEAKESESESEQMLTGGPCFYLS